MLSCREITALLSKESLTKLSLKEKIELRLHLMMCKLCARYAKQIKFISRVFKMLPEQSEQEEGLSSEAKLRIKQKLSE